MVNYIFIGFFILVAFLLIRLGIRKVIGDYKKRERVMNESERELYLILQKKLGVDFIVLSKVRIEDFVDITNIGEEWSDIQSLREKLKSRHVDFLICDLETTEPLTVIALDGERDEFIDELSKKIKLPIERIRVGDNFAKEVGRIKSSLLSYS